MSTRNIGTLLALLLVTVLTVSEAQSSYINCSAKDPQYQEMLDELDDINDAAEDQANSVRKAKAAVRRAKAGVAAASYALGICGTPPVCGAALAALGAAGLVLDDTIKDLAHEERKLDRIMDDARDIAKAIKAYERRYCSR